MNKFKIPALIFAAVFVVSAAALFMFIKKDISEQPATEVTPPAWVHKEGSSGKQAVNETVTAAQPEVKEEEVAEPVPAQPEPQKQVNATAPDPVKEPEPAPIAKKVEEFKETLVNEIFLDNLAQYIADSYQPAGSLPHNPEKGYSTASFKGINTYFGLNLHGLMPEAKSLSSARESIWAELLTPKYISGLYGKYGTTLLDLVEEKGIMAEREFAAGATSEKRGLTTGQRAEMFRTCAKPLRHTAAVLTAVAENRDLLQAMDSYLKAEKRVEIANGLFQVDLNQAENSDSENARNKAAFSAKELKEAITIREKIKTGITTKIEVSYKGTDKDLNDSFYVAKWVFRRAGKNRKHLASILAGSKVLDSLADQMDKRAALIAKSE